ncbi:MAG: methyltransferase protein [Modestobacter sp.]|nr:methyltransferase protein [Modestobacter sp.]
MSVSKYDIELTAGEDQTSHGLMQALVGANKRVLDVGCSTGYLAKALGERGNVVSGIEYDPAAAEKARPFLAQLVVGDLEDVGIYDEFADGAFDVVVFGDVLEHLRDPLPVLRRARRLLAPGGSVVISVPNVAHGDVRLSLLAGRFDYRDTGLLDETHVRFFTRRNLDRFLREAGFTAVDVRSTTAPLFGTELQPRREDYAADVVAALEADPDALIYQFVLQAAPDDAVQAESEVAWRLMDTQRELAAARQAAAATEQELAQVRSELDRSTQELQRTTDALRAAESAREQAETARRTAEEELERLYETKTMRAVRLPRRVYGRLRR